MNLNKIYDFNNCHGISDIYSFSGSCGKYDGEECVTKETQNGFQAVREHFTLTSEITNRKSVYMRTDILENTSDEDIYINSYSCRFAFEGGEFDVYTQMSHWQNESVGEWQKLVTEVSSSAKGIYTTSTATPMAALWNRQTNRGVVFHLMPKHSWCISVSKKNRVSDAVFTVVEISICDDSLNLKLPPNEKFEFSPVVYFEFKDRQTIDCYKLHSFINALFPRRDMPVMYNTWLSFYDKVNYENVSGQITEAADIGCEYFVLDAGWFGKGAGSWGTLVGQWEENLTGGYKGKMKDISDLVHKNNMKFGLWLEPERSGESAEILKEHPEYFIKGDRSYFLDFSNDTAREYITGLTLDLIERYNIDYMKFDFNDNIISDPRNSGFYLYHKGYIKYITDIKEKHPDMYMECCAGGGFRLDLEKLRVFDSFWFSDNQSPAYGLEIIKNTILRMPPQAIDRWLSVTSRDNFISAYDDVKPMRILAPNNGIWDKIISVNVEYIKGFIRGGAAGITCDLTKVDKKTKASLKEFISEYKKEKDFWINATARILCDTDSFLAVQYENKDEIKIVVNTKRVTQSKFTLYPVIDCGNYSVDGKFVSYEKLIEEGIEIDKPQSDFSYHILLKKDV